MNRNFDELLQLLGDSEGPPAQDFEDSSIDRTHQFSIEPINAGIPVNEVAVPARAQDANPEKVPPVDDGNSQFLPAMSRPGSIAQMNTSVFQGYYNHSQLRNSDFDFVASFQNRQMEQPRTTESGAPLPIDDASSKGQKSKLLGSAYPRTGQASVHGRYQRRAQGSRHKTAPLADATPILPNESSQRNVHAQYLHKRRNRESQAAGKLISANQKQAYLSTQQATAACDASLEKQALSHRKAIRANAASSANAHIQQKYIGIQPQPQLRSNTLFQPTTSAPRTVPNTQHQREKNTLMSFCRYSVDCMRKLTSGREDGEEIMTSTRRLVKNLWAKWSDGKLSKADLLSTIGKTVMENSPGKSLNVVVEFKVWYKKELGRKSEESMVPQRRRRTLATKQNVKGVERRKGLDCDLGKGNVPNRRLKEKARSTKDAAAERSADSQGDHLKTRDLSKGIDVTNNIIDMELERDNLTTNPDQVTSAVMGSEEDDMLLDAGVLKSKMEKILKRHRMNPSVTQELLEIISHAARERMAHVLVNVAEAAQMRLDTEKRNWEAEPDGENVRALIEETNDNEERKLSVQSDLRTIMYRQKKSNQAHESQEAGSVTDGDKKGTDSPGKKLSKAKQKRLAANEAQRQQTQYEALSGAIKGIGSKRKKINMLADLPPPLIGCGILPGALKSSTRSESQSAPPCSILLEDALWFAETDTNMRHSSLLYKWLARLGRPPNDQF